MGFAPVEIDSSDVDAEGLEIVVGFVVLVRYVEESFGGNAPNIETGSAEGASLFDADGVESELCSFDGCYIT